MPTSANQPTNGPQDAGEPLGAEGFGAWPSAYESGEKRFTHFIVELPAGVAIYNYYLPIP